MRKVTLLGDSIRQIGYGTRVPELLKDEFTVYQPQDNCRYAKYTLRGLYDWDCDIRGSEIIHWNNGMWDVSDLYGNGRLTPPEEYVRDMLRIYEVLSSRYTKKIIFATTTPVWEPYDYQDNEIIRHYNACLVPELQKRGVIINDLYSLISRDIPAYIREEDRLHLTARGIEAAAQQVAACIRDAAK